VLRAASEIGFELARYDKAKPLVIDPTLLYGSYFGPVNAKSITTDRRGNIYLGGSASGGAALVNPVQSGMHGNVDVWVAKLDPTGTVLLYSTYVGGSAEDQPITQSSLAVTARGELIAAIQSFSPDFPLVNAIQSQGPPVPTSSCLPVVFKLNAAGNAFVYSTYIGGNPPEGATPWAVATDAAGDAYVAGEADGVFATTPGAYQSSFGGGWADAFVAKLGPRGALLYSTMVGGAGTDYATGIELDPAGNSYITGLTSSASFPNNPPGAVTTNAGGYDVFVAKINTNGTAVDWLTFLGGTGDDNPTTMARNRATGELYVAGSTTSTDLPTTARAFQPASNGLRQGFIASVNPNGMGYGFVTYLGGNREDWISGLALTPTGLVVVGLTTSTSFPTANAIQPAFLGGGYSLYASGNSGASWTPDDTGLGASVAGISVDPSNPATMLAASGDSFAWFRTTNGGASWTRSGESSLFFWYHAGGVQLLRSPANPAVIYACYPYSVGQPPNRVNAVGTFSAFGSNDGGATWRLLATPPGVLADFNDWLTGMAVSPTDANLILEVTYKGLVFRSADGGATFTAATSLPSGTTWGYPDEVGVGSDRSVYAAAGENVYKSADFGTTWTQGTGIPAWQGMGSLAVSPSNPLVVYAGTAWQSPNALYKTIDGGATWNKVTLPSVGFAYGTSLVVAPTNPQIVYAASGNQTAVSTDGGVTWSSPTTLPGNIWTIAVSPTDPTAVYAAAGQINYNGFAAKIGTNGRTLRWSTFYNGSAGSSPAGVAADPSGDVWIFGNTSPGLPITANALSSKAYGGSAFLAHISDATAACSYSLNPPSIVSYGAQSVSFGVTAPSGCAWTATPSDGSWIGVPSGAAGTASGVVTTALTSNTTGSTRTGDVSINGQSFAITQADASCTYSLSAPASLPSSGGTVQIAVTAPSGCPWSAIPGSPLVSVVSGGSGTGNGTVTLSLPPNGGVAWLSPTVQVGPQTVTLQEADACSFSLSPLSLAAAAASGSFGVTANAAGCSWNPTSDAAWLTVSGSGTGTGTFAYTVQANTTAAARVANITLDHQQFTVTQAP
jgi:hypothetical protein